MRNYIYFLLKKAAFEHKCRIKQVDGEPIATYLLIFFARLEFLLLGFQFSRGFTIWIHKLPNSAEGKKFKKSKKIFLNLSKTDKFGLYPIFKAKVVIDE